MTDELNTYLKLCTEVYDITKPDAPEDAFKFYLDYAKKAKGKVLEPMCGTGRFLIPMKNMGIDIEGFDASDAMLEKCYNKLGLKNPPYIWKNFVQDLKRDIKYELIFIPSGSFCLIISPGDIKKTLKVIYQHLSDGGVFVFDIEAAGSPHLNEKTDVWKASTHYYSDGRFIMLSTLNLPVANNIGRTIGKYELVENNRITQTEIEDFILRFYEPAQLEEWLKEAGFSKIRFMKSYDQSKSPDKFDESITVECRK